MSVWKITLTAGKGWMADGASRLAAAVAFFTALSLTPLLTLIIAVLGIVLGEEAAQGLLVEQIASVTDQQSARFIQSLIAQSSDEGANILAAILGFIVLVWGATRLFYEIQEALDYIWENKTEGQPLKTAIKRRALALGMCLVVAFLLLVSMAVNTALAYVVDSVTLDLPGSDVLWLALSMVASFVIIAVLFALLYKFLPLAHVPWKSAWWGGIVAAGLFTAGRGLFGLYLAKQDDVQGAAGALIAVLLWVYFSAQVFFFGAEIGKAVKANSEAE